MTEYARYVIKMRFTIIWSRYFLSLEVPGIDKARLSHLLALHGLAPKDPRTVGFLMPAGTANLHQVPPRK